MYKIPQTISPVSIYSLPLTTISTVTSTVQSNQFNNLNQINQFNQLNQFNKLNQINQPDNFLNINNIVPNTVQTTIHSINVPIIKPIYVYDIDTGLNDNYNVQRDITKYIQYKTLDKWIYKDFPSLLKYLKIENKNVRLVKNLDEKENNDISKDSEEDMEAKSDWIEKNIFTELNVRELLIKIIKLSGIKWYEIPHRQELIIEAVKHYLKKKLSKHL
jgi:hypothetical protein